MGERQGLRGPTPATIGNIRATQHVVHVMKTRLSLALVAAALVLASCGGTTSAPTPVPTTTPSTVPTTAPATTADESGTDDQPAPPEPADGQAPETEPAEVDPINGPFPESQFPDVVVEDLAGGQVNTKFFATLDKPVLLWFWAPH